MLRRVGFDASLEKAGLLGHSNERPGDIFIHTYMTGRPAALDITVSSVVQSSSLSKASQDTGFVIRAAKARKDHKFYEKCASEGIDFIPLAVESLGGWGESALGVFKQIAQRKSYYAFSSFSFEFNQILQQLSVCLQRENAAMILSRLV